MWQEGEEVMEYIFPFWGLFDDNLHHQISVQTPIAYMVEESRQQLKRLQI